MSDRRDGKRHEIGKRRLDADEEQRRIEECRAEWEAIQADPSLRRPETSVPAPAVDPDIGGMLANLLARVNVRPVSAPYQGPCGLPSWDAREAQQGALYCHDGNHYRDEKTRSGKVEPHWLGRCPMVIAEERRQRIATVERQRGRWLFADYRPAKCKNGQRAYNAVRGLACFAHDGSLLSTPSPRRVVLSGETGLGKSHLLLAAYLEVLRRGHGAEYVTAEEVRPAFRMLNSYDAEKQAEATTRVQYLARVPWLFLDEIGRVRGSPQMHADFAAGLLLLLDWRRQQNPDGALGVATNLTSDGAGLHPDVGDIAWSRLCDGAEVVEMKGPDQRAANGVQR